MTADDDVDLSIYDGRWVLSGKDSSLWVELAWEGQDDDLPFTLDDGREVDEVIQSEGLREIADRLWLTVSGQGRTDDMLWSTGGMITVVSRAMADALVAAGAENLDIIPTTIRRARSVDLTDYVIVVPTGEGPDRPVREYPLGRRVTVYMDVSAEVLDALRHRGFDSFTVDDARQLSEDWAAAAEIPLAPVQRDSSPWDLLAGGEAGQGELRLRVLEGTEASLFVTPKDLLPGGGPSGLRQNDDGSGALVSPDGAVTGTLGRPAAVDAAGADVNAFWFEDEGELILNVDHLPGVHAYPVTVRTAVR